MTSSGTRWGGFFSIALALEHPGRVRRLVLIGAPAGLDRPIPLFLRLWGNSITGALIRRMRIKDAETFRRRVYPLLVAHPERVPVDLLEMNVAAAALPGVAWSAYTMPRSVTTLGGFRRSVMLREELARLAVPTLFLWGRRRWIRAAFKRPVIGAQDARGRDRGARRYGPPPARRAPGNSRGRGYPIPDEGPR